MIFDKIENVKIYPQIPDYVADFILQVNTEQPAGRVYLADDKSVWANVDEYTTKPYENCKFEAHEKYIDIQFMLSGEEKIEAAFADELEVSDTYNEDRDVMFLKDTESKLILPMKKGYFALFYPTDAHKPQVAYPLPQKVKKVVVKIPV